MTTAMGRGPPVSIHFAYSFVWCLATALKHEAQINIFILFQQVD